MVAGTKEAGNTLWITEIGTKKRSVANLFLYLEQKTSRPVHRTNLLIVERHTPAPS